MTDNQILRALRAAVDADGLYVTANRIGITHSTLTRFLSGMRCQKHVHERVEAFAEGKSAAPKKTAAKKASAPTKATKKPKAKASTKKPSCPVDLRAFEAPR